MKAKITTVLAVTLAVSAAAAAFAVAPARATQVIKPTFAVTADKPFPFPLEEGIAAEQTGRHRRSRWASFDD